MYIRILKSFKILDVKNKRDPNFRRSQFPSRSPHLFLGFSPITESTKSRPHRNKSQRTRGRVRASGSCGERAARRYTETRTGSPCAMAPPSLLGSTDLWLPVAAARGGGWATAAALLLILASHLVVLLVRRRLRLRLRGGGRIAQPEAAVAPAPASASTGSASGLVTRTAFAAVGFPIEKCVSTGRGWMISDCAVSSLWLVTE
jgi:hypothetical protein